MNRHGAKQHSAHFSYLAHVRPCLQVDVDLFVLDFNPSFFTALQAFALGLSTFDRKFFLFE